MGVSFKLYGYDHDVLILPWGLDAPLCRIETDDEPVHAVAKANIAKINCNKRIKPRGSLNIPKYACIALGKKISTNNLRLQVTINQIDAQLRSSAHIDALDSVMKIVLELT